MSAPTLLAFDTATERLCIALVTGGRVHLHDADGGPKASAALIPAALALLKAAGLELSALDAVAFGRGPGAFTGLRTACAVAQGLAFGLGVPVLPLDSLLLVAEDARAQGAGDDLWVAVDARMDEVYAARYRHQGGHDGPRWRPHTAPALYTLPALAAQWRAAPPAALAGNAAGVFGARLLDGLPDVRRIDTERSRAGALGALAEAAWRDGPRLDPADALPLYLRDKVALTSVEREAAKALRRAMEPAR